MYTVNEIALDNPTFGWTLMRGTQLLNIITKELSSVGIPGRRGVLHGIPSYNGAPVATVVVRTGKAGLEPLYSLFTANGGNGVLRLTADTSRATEFELAAINPQGLIWEDELIDVTISLRFSTAAWRDTAATITSAVTPSGPVEAFTMLPGISADISDADIFVSGNFGNFELQDVGSGSWLKTVLTWPYVASTGLLYVGSTGQAFRATTAAPWTPTADMSSYVDVSGGGGFRITPTWSSDPSDRLASLELTTTNQSGVTYRVRATNAYELRNGAI